MRITIWIFSSVLFIASAFGAAHAADSDEHFVRLFQAQQVAAQKGDAKAIYYLGEMYEQGVGTPVNIDAAKEWYTKAAAQGNDLARQKLDHIEALRANETARREQEQKTAEALKAKQLAEAQARAAIQAQAQAKERATALAVTRARQAELDAARARERAAADAAARARLEAQAREQARLKQQAGTEGAAKTRPPAAAARTATTQVQPPDSAPVPAPVSKPAATADAEFSGNPCKGPQAKFLSTCH